jgi:hypothetical protein
MNPITAGYFRFRARDGKKVYVPSLVSAGRERHLRVWFKRATEAKDYAEAAMKRLERFLSHGKEKEIHSPGA